MWLPWRLSGKESACQCRGLGLEPWVRKIPYYITIMFIMAQMHILVTFALKILSIEPIRVTLVFEYQSKLFIKTDPYKFQELLN